MDKKARTIKKVLKHSDALGFSYRNKRMMIERGYIPAKHFMKIVDVVNKNGDQITYQDLHELLPDNQRV